jgi:hypothetical protein
LALWLHLLPVCQKTDLQEAFVNMKTSKKKRFQSQYFLAPLVIAMLFRVGNPASGQSTVPTPGPVGPPTPNSVGPPAVQPQDSDMRHSEIVSFDKFIDAHPEVAEQLRNNPSLINREDFLEHHPELQEYLQQHPQVREEISENPNAFMNQESRFDQREGRQEVRDRDDRGDRDVRRVAVFDRFLDRHPELAEQLRKNPSLVNNQEFLENHPALQQFLRDNPGIGTEINENPKAFMHEEERFDRHEDQFNRSDDRSNPMTDRDNRATAVDRDERSTAAGSDDRNATNTMTDRDNRSTDRDQTSTATDRGQPATAAAADRDDRAATADRDQHSDETTVGARARENATGDRDATTTQLASTDRFFDSHPEIAEQLQKNPSLLNDKDFVKHHPALQDYLKSHPEIRAEIRQNPNEFMRQEARFDQREALSTRSMDRDDMASFGAFLGAHGSLATQLSKNPSLANNKEFQASHPELQEFLKAHPAVQAQLTSNPQTAMSSVQATSAAKTGARATEPKPPMKH